MIVFTALRFMHEVLEEALALREQVLAGYPHLRDEV
jgi:hypothetical protein